MTYGERNTMNHISPVSTLKYFYDVHELHEMGLFISLIQTVDTQKFAFAVEFQFNTAV